MDRFDLYRLLAADQLDLLDAAEKEALREGLRLHPDIDVAAFRARVREALTGGEDIETFVASLADAERSVAAAGTAPPAPVSRARPFALRPLRIALVAAAASLALWIGGQWVARDRDAGPGIGQTLHLDVVRDDGVPRVDLDIDAATHITLVATVRDPGPLAWELRDGADRTIDRGTLAAESRTQAPRLVTLPVPKARLRAASHYSLVVTSPAGEIIGQWGFETE